MLNAIKTNKGFSLLEVLIAMIILSVGLLGLASLQANTLKMNHGAYQRGQAVFLAYDMMDRMRANRTAALNEEYDRDIGDAAPSGSGLPDVDVEEWINDYVSVLLTAGDGAIDCVPSSSVCTVTIEWDESRMGGTSTSSGAIVSFAFSATL